MGIGKCFSMAISSIMSSKVRSLLTMLGIIIGIAAVIILVSLMNGLTSSVTGMFEELGTNTINVSIMSRATTKTVDPDEMFELADENPELFSAVSPNVTVSATIKNGSENISSSASGVSELYADMNSLVVEQGRFIQYIDVERSQKVCVIGTYQEKELFGGTGALGQNIKINGVPYSIVGVLEESGDSSSGSEDDCIYIPYTNALKLNGTSTVSSYVVSAADEEHVTEAVETIEDLLYKKIGDEDYYNVISMLSMIEQMDEIMGQMSTMLIAIAGISLLVGGIGIMNIMLVSVSERTREIGIRKSLGAKQHDIMMQFVIEAGTVSCIGGIIGIVFGSIVSILAGKLLDMEVMPSVASVIISFCVSVAIGIGFGYLPAKKAARLNPIDALRYD